MSSEEHDAQVLAALREVIELLRPVSKLCAIDLRDSGDYDDGDFDPEDSPSGTITITSRGIPFSFE